MKRLFKFIRKLWRSPEKERVTEIREAPRRRVIHPGVILAKPEKWEW
jgi:hypothetical protein